MANLLGSIGAAQPVTQFIDTALKYQTVQEQAKFREQEIQNLEQRRRILGMQEQEMARNNELIHSDIPLAQTPEHLKPVVKSYWQTSGLMDEKGFLRRVDIRETPEKIKAYLAANNEAQAQAIAATLPAIQSEAEKIAQKINKLAGAGGPMLPGMPQTAEIEALKKQHDNLARQYSELRQQQIGLDPDLRKVQLAAELAQDKTTAHNIPEGGTLIITDAKGKVVQQIEGKPKKVDQWSEPYEMVIEGKKVLVKRNLTTNEVKPVASGTTVNVDVNTGLSKGGRTEAEKDVQKATDVYTGLADILAITKPEYLTYAGRAQQYGEAEAEKIGLKKDPEFLKGYTEWKIGLDQEFNKYRTAVTGAAASDKELERILKNFPNYKMSKTEYEAAIKTTAITYWKLAERRKRALEAGVMENDTEAMKNFYKSLPLDRLPNPPPNVLERFMPKKKGTGNWVFIEGNWVEE